MDRGRLNKVSASVANLNHAESQTRTDITERQAALEARVASLEGAERTAALVAERDVAYARMHQLLAALWGADESGTFSPKVDGQQKGPSYRYVEPEGYPSLKLMSQGAAHSASWGNYAISYNIEDSKTPIPDVLYGLHSQWCFSEVGIETGIATFGDPRGVVEKMSDDNIAQHAAAFQENVDTLQRICLATGMVVPGPITATPEQGQ